MAHRLSTSSRCCQGRESPEHAGCSAKARVRSLHGVTPPPGPYWEYDRVLPEESTSFLEAQRRYLAHHGVTAESEFVDLPGLDVRLHVLTAGNGHPVLMVNGIGLPAAMWAPLMAGLRGIRVHAIDLPSFGLTGAYPALARTPRQEGPRFLSAAMDALQLRQATVISCSLGSLLSIWLSLDDPSRLSGHVHLGCPAVVLGSSAPLPMRLMSSRVLGPLLMRLQPPSARQVQALAKVVRQYPLEPLLVDLLVETERGPHYAGAMLEMLHSLLRLRGARPGPTLTEEQLSRVVARTLIIWGKDDPFGGIGVARRMLASLPAAHLEVVPGGHAPWLTSPHQGANLVNEFVLSLQGSAS